MDKKLFLIDAFAIIFRSYYAFIRNPRITSKGKNTNAQFGFTNTLLEIIQKEKPTHIAVCFDREEPTQRHIDFPAYKAHRQETPEDIIQSIPDIKKILEGFQIPILGVAGYEADDVIASIALQAKEQNFSVFIVTPDKDFGQILQEGIYMYKPLTKGNGFEVIDASTVCKQWGIQSVHQIIDLLGLMGDAADNIPGVKGIGEKTAVKLLQTYESIEAIIAHANEIPGSIGEKIKANIHNAIMSKKLATIETKVPILFDATICAIQPYNQPILEDILQTLECKTLLKRLFGTSSQVNIPSTTTPILEQVSLFETDIITVPITSSLQPFATIHNTPHQYHTIQTPKEIELLVKTLLQQNEICIDTETTDIHPLKACLVGISLSYKAHEAYYIPCFPDDKEKTHLLLTSLIPIFEQKHIQWIGHNLKYDLLVLSQYHISLKGTLYDTMLAQYVIEPEGKKNMDILSEQYLHYQPIAIETLIGKKGKSQGNMKDVSLPSIAVYAAEDADITLQLKYRLDPLLEEKKVTTIFHDIEMPLLPVLLEMEKTGVCIDVDFLKHYTIQLQEEARIEEEKVFTLADMSFNLSSPKQLGEVLFQKLKLNDQAKTTKTGQFATNQEVLEKLAYKHPIIAHILNFRELSKLISTYTEALPQMIDPITKRLHTSFSQALVVTGRLSSNQPNLQNIPIRTQKGKEIRKAFIPKNKDFVLLSADYSQIELRIIAALSGDKNMCEAFQLGKDIHIATAAKVFHIEEALVTKEQRYRAKGVNFGIIYGQGAFGLSENLHISRSEAQSIINNYKKEFAGIAQYMEYLKDMAKKNGFVETWMGRKRWLPDIHSQNFTVRGFAERNAINSPIQGTAADLIKLAMIRVYKVLKEKKLQSTLIIQVHDELVLEVPIHEIDIIKEIVLREMKHAMSLPHEVPIEASIGIGNNWLEAHE